MNEMNESNREIERKFLVNVDKLPADLNMHQHILQGYIYYDSPLVRVRIVQQAGLKAYITFKGRGLLSRDEVECEIDVSKAQHILDLWCTDKIEKYRYRIGRWEVDKFFGPLDGLWLAEIELHDEKEEVDLPEWVGTEVTNDPRYTNVQLARNGLPKPKSDYKFPSFSEPFRKEMREMEDKLVQKILDDISTCPECGATRILVGKVVNECISCGFIWKI